MDLTKLLTWLHVKPKHLFAVCVLAAVLLWSPAPAWLGVVEWRDQYHAWIADVHS